MRFAVIVFPGTWSDKDCGDVLTNVFHQEVDYVWHKETDLSSYDCAILPGGFSYGDYLRAGAIARFSPVMEQVTQMANDGRLVIGICNGFQILCESGLLPGVLTRNAHLQYRCQWTQLRVENTRLPFTNNCEQDQILKIPISHGEGNYFAPPDILDRLNRNGQIAFRYSNASGNITDEDNPNGSLDNIAGIVNENGNVLGMMPHPERSCEANLGSIDGSFIFESMIDSYLAQQPAKLST
ncbi:MAG: phosphoribosylformylglycinamidine synthase subunit PurQ [SAR202 cluster bacterium]|nr:phosphoribosylformylglycinamidine synthase subunit PurQ [SAR202 cluster bacterium]|tara:strand:- start:417 stop:1133 length:717 start_codon:yes stop_codon:yes gene_type:complete